MRAFLSVLKSVLIWMGKVPILWLGKASTLLLAPIVAIPFFVRKEDEVALTGFQTGAYKGEPREFLIPRLMWMQTHDAPLDEYRLGGYYKGKWTERFKNWKYFMRICWLWRNSAYGLAESLGWEQDGAIPIKGRDNGTWRTPVNDYQYWLAVNGKGQYGWMLRGQFRVWKDRYIEYRLGYGVYRESPKKNKGMMYARIFKFRKFS